MAHYEPGDYKARIVRQGFSESKHKSTPFFFIEILPFESLGANELPSPQYKRTLDWYCTEKTMQYVIEKLRFLGWNGTKLSELEPGAANHHSFVDQEIDVYCTITAEGYEDWQLSTGRGGGSSGPEEQKGVAAKLDKLFGKQLMAAVPTGKKAESKPRPAPQPVAVDSEEIPF